VHPRKVTKIEDFLLFGTNNYSLFKTNDSQITINQ